MSCAFKESNTRKSCVKTSSNKPMDKKCEIRLKTSRCVLKKIPPKEKKKPSVEKKKPSVEKKHSFVEKIMEPGDILYHGSKKKIDFCQLGAECEIEPYGFSTDDYAYAKGYAGGKGKVTAWTPVKKLRILVLSRASLSAAIKWIRDEYKEKVVDNKVAKKIATKEFLMHAFKVVNTDALFKKLLKTKGTKFNKTNLYEHAKKMKPYEFFGIGDRFDKNAAKEIRKGRRDYRDTNRPGGLRAYTFHCYESTERMKKENVACAPISLTNAGFFRHSYIGYDVGMYHYLFKYLKHMKYDGVKLVTKGFGNDAGGRTKNKVEFVIGNKMLKKVELPEFVKNIDKNIAKKEKERIKIERDKKKAEVKRKM